MINFSVEGGKRERGECIHYKGIHQLNEGAYK